VAALTETETEARTRTELLTARSTPPVFDPDQAAATD
jgi:hypothetical protein